MSSPFWSPRRFEVVVGTLDRVSSVKTPVVIAMMCSLLPQPLGRTGRNGFCKPLKTILKSPSWTALQNMLSNTSDSSSSSDEEDEAPAKLQRSKSLGPPLSPKKSVRFADTHGLALAQVFNIRDTDRESSPVNSHRVNERRGRMVKSLSLTCSQPASAEGFLEKVRCNCVCLENVAIRGMCVMGTVRVTNLSYEKRVSLRWTTNNWTTCEESEATYVTGSSDGESDRFAFELKVPERVEAGQKIQFAVRYRPAGDKEYWDNNDCKNYSLECYAQWKKEKRDAWHDAGGAKGSIFGSPL